MGFLPFLRLVRFEHTVFALPFALLGFLWAGGRVPSRQLALVLSAMVGARSAAMAFNRLADLRFDAANPRAREWPLVKGEVTVRSAWLLFAAMSAIFFASAWLLNPLALALSPVAFVLVTGYSLTKRFTWACHLALGLALACAPVGGWVAARAAIDPVALLLAGAVALWVAGFDILYACQDAGIDRAQGLQSVPARFGVPAALILSRILHAGSAAILAAIACFAPVGPFFWAGVALFAGLLACEQSLVRADDLSRLDAAFFTVNGLGSVAFFVLAALDRFR